MLDLWKEKIEEIYIGYKNLLLYKFGKFDESDCVEYKRKKSICNQSCPLHSKLLGISYCNPRKEFGGENGCGCIIEAKLWSDSPCPLNKF